MQAPEGLRVTETPAGFNPATGPGQEKTGVRHRRPALSREPQTVLWLGWGGEAESWGAG